MPLVSDVDSNTEVFSFELSFFCFQVSHMLAK